jgi:hypothetical protein
MNNAIDPCVTCRDYIHALTRLAAGTSEHRSALRELAEHLTNHAEGRVA